MCLVTPEDTLQCLITHNGTYTCPYDLEYAFLFPDGQYLVA